MASWKIPQAQDQLDEVLLQLAARRGEARSLLLGHDMRILMGYLQYMEV